MVIKLARHDGIKTVNVVRRPEAIDELKALGADVVISSVGRADRRAGPRASTGTDGVRYALDPVGGDTGTGVFESLAADGRMLVYGTLSGEPLRVDPRRMIAGKRVVEGFWLGHWVRERNIPQMLLLFREIAAMIRAGVLDTEVGATFPLEAVGDAVRAAEVVGRRGKVLLKPATS